MNGSSLFLSLCILLVCFFNSYEAFLLRNPSSEPEEYLVDASSDWNRQVSLITKQVLDFLRSRSGKDVQNEQYMINEQTGYMQQELAASSSRTGQLQKRAKSRKKGGRRRKGKECVGRFGPLIHQC
ncbi:uncharacterized protein LOC117109631 [Anneissia japonica]|uniref:uncharacterized protein LOC117109631 n=1 Tax=Anneissia japonica TaxID=1529436 RepID=UPI001425B5E4|nr:uncharacterized protein LOC117109631 [Anneissia japonica]